MLDCDLEILYPAHVAPSHDVKKLITDTIQHRLGRLDQMRTLLEGEPRSVEAMASKVYPGADHRMEQMTVRTTRAALQHLARLGQAREVETDQFVRAG